MMVSLVSSWTLLLVSLCSIWAPVDARMLRRWSDGQGLEKRDTGYDYRDGQSDVPDTSAFNIVNGRVFTPGLGIIRAPQPFTPMGGDFLHIALDVSGDGKLPVPPRATANPLTQIFNITLFLTSTLLQKNFTISNATSSTPPLANIMNQEPGQTVKHINFAWPDCLVGDGDNTQDTARGAYNISIHQNYRLNGANHYTIFDLPISVTNSIPRSPGTDQMSANPAPGPLRADGGRVNCASMQNPMLDAKVWQDSVNNPSGQPMQDIVLETATGSNAGSDGQGQAAPGQGQTTLGGAGRTTAAIWMVVGSAVAAVASMSAVW